MNPPIWRRPAREGGGIVTSRGDGNADGSLAPEHREKSHDGREEGEKTKERPTP